MNRPAYLPYKISPYIIVAIVYVLYVVVFAIYQNSVGTILASLAIIPVIAGSWYFGIRGGVLTAIFSILANTILRMLSGYSYIEFITALNTIIGNFALICTAFMVGKFGTVTRERSDALAKLEALEKNRQAYTKFLELLNEITG
jgi:hypothetical protein